MARATRTERREARELGASARLYRRARRAGATHGEIVSVLGQERPFWRYEVFRTGGATHAEALALDAEGVDPIAYRDLRRMGVAASDIEGARHHGASLGQYVAARRAGLSHDDAVVLVSAGFRGANDHVWERAAKARGLLADRGLETTETLALLGQRAQGSAADAGDLVDEIAREAGEGRSHAA